jgi:hypothetical protein
MALSRFTRIARKSVNLTKKSNFHQSTSVIADPLGLDKDYGKESIVRMNQLSRRRRAQRSLTSYFIRSFLVIVQIKEQITN